MKTEAQVIAYLEGVVGKIPVDASNPNLNGQCVALIKALMNFLGVPNPYAARGNARDVGDTYLAQGIASPGKGRLTICISRTMSAPYGHVWVEIGGNNYESNGAVAKRVTKNTRPISQAQQFVNLDKWLKGGIMAKLNLGVARILAEGILGRDTKPTHDGKFDSDLNKNHVGKELTNNYIDSLWKSGEARAWQKKRATLEAFYNTYNKKIEELSARPTKAQLEALQQELAKKAAAVDKAEAKLLEEQAKRIEDTELLDGVGSWLTRLIDRLFKRS